MKNDWKLRKGVRNSVTCATIPNLNNLSFLWPRRAGTSFVLLSRLDNSPPPLPPCPPSWWGSQEQQYLVHQGSSAAPSHHLTWAQRVCLLPATYPFFCTSPCVCLCVCSKAAGLKKAHWDSGRLLGRPPASWLPTSTGAESTLRRLKGSSTAATSPHCRLPLPPARQGSGSKERAETTSQASLPAPGKLLMPENILRVRGCLWRSHCSRCQQEKEPPPCVISGSRSFFAPSPGRYGPSTQPLWPGAAEVSGGHC